MSNNKTKLTREEKDFINTNENFVSRILGGIESAKRFKLNDFLIAYRVQQLTMSHLFTSPAKFIGGKRELVTNSYGITKKFQVVHIDKHGIPYIRELNKNNKPAGNMYCPIKWDFDGHDRRENLEFEIDPDYADALIMADGDNFDPTQIQKLKSDLFKEITQYNKNSKICTTNDKQLADFLDTLKVGDVLYRSIKTHWVVEQILPVPKDKTGRIKPFDNFLVVRDSKGLMHSPTFDDLRHIALYKNRPRSYKELK